MKILIAGAGRLGSQIAQVLAAGNNDVTLVEQDGTRLSALAHLSRVRLVLGDACDTSLMEHAGSLTCDLVIAATGRDEDNLVISMVAKRRFGVARVAARVNDAENAWLFDQRWGVDVAVPTATPLISLIEEATGATDTVALLRLSKAGVEVMETAITERSRAAGHTLGEISLPAGTVVASVVRDGRPTVPGPDMRLLPGDELLLVSHEATEHEIHAAFQ
ncbi:TrkA family potassium uptake protein [Streptomyces sp. Ag109_O5-10]|uniref:potassium channel family protein n=1 Tax=Streptomyces sp. Ag109_O5-10 TaxID=1855349 RepID=UPI0008998C96|nr:TrkA family potassium uptake protein [Streptomyces sp. Ag109_O5-10]SEF17540.1 trk system potassium uptake protein TrkA [Streptomyces sp. Ag109_O5-10]